MVGETGSGETGSGQGQTRTLAASVIRWLGIAAAALWLFQGLSGALLSYHFEANDALLSRAEVPLDYAAIEKRMDAFEAQGGDAKVNWIWSTGGLPGRFLLNYTNAQGTDRLARIAGDGSVLTDTTAGQHTALETVRELHLALGSGKTGEWILAISGIVLLVSLVRAFRHALKLRRTRSADPDSIDKGAKEVRLRSWYQSLSLWGAVPAFVVAGAAVVINFEHQIEGPIGAPPITMPAIAPQGGGVGFAAAVMAAEKAVPGSRFVGSPMPTKDDASYKAWVNQPGEYFRPEGYGGSLVIVSANDASVRGAWPLQQASTAYKAIALPYPVHTGEISGPLGRMLVLLVGLWLAVWAAIRLLLALRYSGTGTNGRSRQG